MAVEGVCDATSMRRCDWMHTTRVAFIMDDMLHILHMLSWELRVPHGAPYWRPFVLEIDKIRSQIPPLISDSIVS